MKQSNHKRLVSEQGVSFTQEALDTMRTFADTLKRDNANAMSWAVTFDGAGELILGLGGDHEPHPKAIPDQLEGLKFYWYAEKQAMDAVRKRSVDAGYGRRSRLLPLPQGGSE